jgi:hypothetical protein
VLLNRLFHFPRLDVLPAGLDQILVGSPGLVKHIPVLIALRQVPGRVPAVAQGEGRFLRQIQVALEDQGTPGRRPGPFIPPGPGRGAGSWNKGYRQKNLFPWSLLLSASRSRFFRSGGFIIIGLNPSAFIRGLSREICGAQGPRTASCSLASSICENSQDFKYKSFYKIHSGKIPFSSEASSVPFPLALFSALTAFFFLL